jgi:hypothetical protein
MKLMSLLRLLTLANKAVQATPGGALSGFMACPPGAPDLFR